MTIELELVNVTDLVVKRPLRDGPGGDSDPANDVVVASGLSAIYERTQRVRRNAQTGDDIITEGVFFLDPTKADGSPLEIRERDYVQHTDATGRLTALLTVRGVGYWSVGPELDHIEVEV